MQAKFHLLVIAVDQLGFGLDRDVRGVMGQVQEKWSISRAVD